MKTEKSWLRDKAKAWRIAYVGGDLGQCERIEKAVNESNYSAKTIWEWLTSVWEWRDQREGTGDQLYSIKY